MGSHGGFNIMTIPATVLKKYNNVFRALAVDWL
jgi:hypothetical protein